MICRVGDAVSVGQAADLSDRLDPTAVARAVRGDAVAVDGTVVAVATVRPGPLHDRVGCLTPDCSIRPRTALAVAARSQGHETPVDGDLAAARAQLATHEEAAGADDAPDPQPSRRSLADASDDVERLRERVAEARGRVQAGGDSDEVDADDTETDPAAALAAAVRDLSEVETAATAARQQHRDARSAARQTRDALQERLRLQDEVANLERTARAHLVDATRSEYEAGLAAVPGYSPSGEPFDAPPDAMALAVARVGALRAPIVLATGRFDTADAASRWLDAPVIRIAP